MTGMRETLWNHSFPANMPAERKERGEGQTLYRQHEISEVCMHAKSASDNLEWRRRADFKFRHFSCFLMDGRWIDFCLYLKTHACVCAHNIIIKGERGESTVGGTITGSLSQEAAAAALWLAAYARDCRRWMAAACWLTTFAPKLA